jgi:DNA-binding NarL/FixJ family response regulator
LWISSVLPHPSDNLLYGLLDPLPLSVSGVPELREGGLDAALIDVTLPDGDGLELVGEINNGGVGHHIPTLVLTASLETSVAGRAMEAGARGALSKVVSMPETVEAIERLFDAPIEGQR